VPTTLEKPWAGMSWADVVERRAEIVHLNTEPYAPKPPADPGNISPWGCRYCDWTQCERNPRHDADQEIPL
jgi:hypothetical protein